MNEIDLIDTAMQSDTRHDVDNKIKMDILAQARHKERMRRYYNARHNRLHKIHRHIGRIAAGRLRGKHKKINK